MTTNTEKQPTCAERIDAELESRIGTFRTFFAVMNATGLADLDDDTIAEVLNLYNPAIVRDPSVSRYEAIRAALEREEPRHLRILDFGAYAGYFAFRLAEDLGAEVVAVDPRPELRDLARKNASPRVTIDGRARDEAKVLDIKGGLRNAGEHEGVNDLAKQAGILPDSNIRSYPEERS